MADTPDLDDHEADEAPRLPLDLDPVNAIKLSSYLGFRLAVLSAHARLFRRLSPEKPVTRAEMADLLDRIEQALRPFVPEWPADAPPIVVLDDKKRK